MGSLHLCYHSHFILVLTVLALGWLMTETGWYQLAESFWWLFSVFSLVDVLWWVLTCDTKIFTLHPYSSMYIHMFLPQTSLFLVFQYFHSRKKDGRCFLWFRSLTSGQLFFHTKWTARCTTWSSAHWEDFPSLLSLKTTPQCGCNAATVCFQLAPTYWSNPSVNQTNAFVFSFSWSYQIPIEPQVWAEGAHGCNSLDLCGRGNPGCLLMHFAGALWSYVYSVLDVTLPSYIFARPAQHYASWVC